MISLRRFAARPKGFSTRLLVCMCLLVVPCCYAAPSLYDFSLVQMDGKEVPLSSFKGKVLLIVNLARNSSFSDQVASLNKVADAYKGQGLIVLGIPSNDFGAEEPGTDADVKQAYLAQHLDFTVLARVSVRGKDQAPLYGFLTGGKDKALSGDVHWNFSKFVVDRTGQVVARFAPDVDPASPALELTLEKVIAGKFTKPDESKDGPAEGPMDDDQGPED